MNVGLINLELFVVALGLVVLLADLWIAPSKRPWLGWFAAAGLAIAFLMSYRYDIGEVAHAFGGMYVMDGTAIFLKKLFLIAGIIVILIAVDFRDRIESGLSEYFSIILFALAGMMFAASSNHFAVLFVAIELITVSFYILVSYQRRRLPSLEAGIKYLILGAFSSGFLVYGIALIYGTTGSLSFEAIAAKGGELGNNPLFIVGVLLLLAGLAFKVAVFPFQVWVPDVYQGAPAPTTAFLAIGSKAAGVVLMVRLVFGVLSHVEWPWEKLFMILAGITILYGSLCAIPQRNLKRLLGYSGIANAGYIMMGIAAMNDTALNGILFYLAAYLFAILAAFLVISIVSRDAGNEDISALAGLGQRSPLLAFTLSVSMISLAGIPPLAGFFGKFLIFKAVVEEAASYSAYYVLLLVAVLGVVISIWYYFGIVKAMYWSRWNEDQQTLKAAPALACCAAFCIVGMIYLGIMPGSPLGAAAKAVASIF